MMSRGYFRRFAAILLAFAVSAALLTGCGGAGSPDTGRENAASGQVNTGQNNSATGQGGSGQDSTGTGENGNAVTVRTAEDFLEAIRPGAEIVIEPGTYRLSDATTVIWASENESWNEAHPYVRLQDCYDGVEAVVQNVDGLIIRGQSADLKQELVIEPRYGTVLTFENCANVKLENLTLGHTDGGVCSGNVLNLDGVKNMELRNLDLYGCGEVAMECWGGTGGLTVYDSILHDCSTAPLSLFECDGDISFYDCTLTDSAGGGYYAKTDGHSSSLSFYHCTFGVEETDVWALHGDVYTEDCTWSELTGFADNSGDYEGDYGDVVIPLFDLAAMTKTTFDADLYSDTGWTGYKAVNQETEEDAAPPSGGDVTDVFLLLRGDGTGTLTGWQDDLVPFLWEGNVEDGLTLTTRGGGTYSAALYLCGGKDNPSLWMAVETESGQIWLY